MNSTMLKEDLTDLKSKLDYVEKEFDIKLKDVEGKEEKFLKVDREMSKYISTNDKLIILNIGGKEYQTKISTLLSVKDTLFYNLIVSNVERQHEILNEYFFDRSNKYFQIFLDFLRTKSFSILNLFTKYELDDIKLEAQYYGFTFIFDKIDFNSKEILFVRWEGSPQYLQAGTHKLEDLMDRSLKGGICVLTPFFILIELNYEHDIVGMEIGGMNGNTQIWSPNYGARAKVYTSCDKIKWKEVGIIPANLGAIIQKVSLIRSFGKYIKFQHTSNLGIGFLSLIKYKEEK